MQSAIRTPGKGTDRYWGKLGCGGGVFSFSEGAPQQPPSEGGKRRTKRRTRTRTRRKGGGSRRMEAAAGGGGKIRRSAFRIARGLGRRVRRREEEPRRADRDPLCNISSIDHYTHRRRAGSPRALAASRQPLDTHTVSLGPSTCAVGRLSLSLSLFQCEGPSPTPSSSTLDSGNRPSRKTRHW